MISSIDPATVGFDVPLCTLLDQASIAGFKAIEFSIRQIEEEISEKGKESVFRLLNTHAARVAQFSCGTGIPGNLAVSDERFEKSLNEWIRYCELGKTMEIYQASLLVNSLKGDSYENYGTSISREKLIERLKKLAISSQEYGIKIVIEICDPLLIEYSREIWDEIKQYSVKLLVDTFNLSKMRNPFAFVKDLPLEAIGWIHIADALQDNRVLPGMGEMDLFYILDIFQKKGYQGGVSLEIYGNADFERLTLESKMQAAKEAFLQSKLSNFFK